MYKRQSAYSELLCGRLLNAPPEGGAAAFFPGRQLEKGKSAGDGGFPLFLAAFEKKSAENVTFCRPKTSKWCNCKTKEIFVAWQGKEKTDGTGNFGEKGKARR